MADNLAVFGIRGSSGAGKTTFMKVITPSPPEGLEPAWRNVNTVEELEALNRDLPGGAVPA